MDGLDWRGIGRHRIWHTRLFASLRHFFTLSTSKFISTYDFMALQNGRGSNPSLAFMAERAPFYYPGPLWIYMRILVSLIIGWLRLRVLTDVGKCQLRMLVWIQSWSESLFG
jgi:hypothetical protein